MNPLKKKKMKRKNHKFEIYAFKHLIIAVKYTYLPHKYSQNTLPERKKYLII